VELPSHGQEHPARPAHPIAESHETTTPLTVQEPPPEPADFEALRKLSRPAAEPGASSETSTTGERNRGETVYTCSMHPKVRQGKAGKCPICGMDLLKAQMELLKTQGGDQ
jgi:hypothetical protein